MFLFQEPCRLKSSSPAKRKNAGASCKRSAQLDGYNHSLAREPGGFKPLFVIERITISTVFLRTA